MLKEGDKAPAFELVSDAGETVKLSDFAGKRLVLYFYPRDNTPGCTREAIAFSEAVKRIAAAGASVVGVSRDSVKSHGSFRDKHALKNPAPQRSGPRVHSARSARGGRRRCTARRWRERSAAPSSSGRTGRSPRSSRA